MRKLDLSETNAAKIDATQSELYNRTRPLNARTPKLEHEPDPGEGYVAGNGGAAGAASDGVIAFGIGS